MWVLSGGGRWYMLGSFDGCRFVPATARLPMTHGPDCYATQTWSDAPGGRRVGISWLFGWNYGCGPGQGTIRNAFPTGPWAGGCLTVPHEYALRRTPDGVRLVQQPVPELEALRTPVLQIHGTTLRPGAPNPLAAVRGKAFDIELAVELDGAARLSLAIAADGACVYEAGCDAARGEIFIDRTNGGHAHVEAFARRYAAPARLVPGAPLRLRMLIDHCSLELFDASGLTPLSAFILPDPERDGLRLSVTGGTCRILACTVHTMRATDDVFASPAG